MASIKVSSDPHFPIQNLPYGIFIKTGSSDARPGVAIGDHVLDLDGDHVLDLKVVADDKHFDGPILSKSDCFQKPTLNEFISLGRPAWMEARKVIQRLLSGNNDPTLRDSNFNRKKCLIPMSRVKMQFPVDVEGITGFKAFYDSLSGVTECVKNMDGSDFKVDRNWLSQPLAYLGRSSSVVVSGTEILSTWNQDSQNSSSNSQPSPSLGPSKKLEFGAIVGQGNKLGNPIDFSKAKDHIFGLVLLDHWNIKDKNMKPFDEKNFSTIISPWIVTLDAILEMAPEPPRQNPPTSQSKDKLSQNPHPSPGTSKDKPPQNPHPSSSTSEGKQPQNRDISFKGHGYCVLFGTEKILPSTN